MYILRVYLLLASKTKQLFAVCLHSSSNCGLRVRSFLYLVNIYTYLRFVYMKIELYIAYMTSFYNFNNFLHSSYNDNSNGVILSLTLWKTFFFFDNYSDNFDISTVLYFVCIQIIYFLAY